MDQPRNNSLRDNKLEDFLEVLVDGPVMAHKLQRLQRIIGGYWINLGDNKLRGFRNIWIKPGTIGQGIINSGI